jgi:hypothetical protein
VRRSRSELKGPKVHRWLAFDIALAFVAPWVALVAENLFTLY